MKKELLTYTSSLFCVICLIITSCEERFEGKKDFIRVEIETLMNLPIGRTEYEIFHSKGLDVELFEINKKTKEEVLLEVSEAQIDYVDFNVFAKKSSKFFYRAEIPEQSDLLYKGQILSERTKSSTIIKWDGEDKRFKTAEKLIVALGSKLRIYFTHIDSVSYPNWISVKVENSFFEVMDTFSLSAGNELDIAYFNNQSDFISIPSGVCYVRWTSFVENESRTFIDSIYVLPNVSRDYFIDYRIAE